MTDADRRYDHLDREALIKLLEKHAAAQTFGLVWERGEETGPDAVALHFDAGLSVGDAPYRHLIVEGDNLDALRFLQLTHQGRVKCIYIDPPYNTGGQELAYHDRYHGKDDAYRHSAWLEFMAQRLNLARELLTPDGVLFVSIDDYEVARLTLLLDGVFPGGKVGTLVWRRRSGSNDVPASFLSVDHEYVLCYAHPGFSFAGLDKDLSGYKDHDPGHPEPWKRGDLSKAHDYRARPNGFYPIHNPIEDIWYAPNPKRVWAFASERYVKQGQKLRRETMEQLIREGRVIFPKKDRTAVYVTLEELRAAIVKGDAPHFLQLGLYDTPAEETAYLAQYVGKRLGYGTPGYKRFRSEVRRANKPLSSWIVGMKEEGEQDRTVLRSGLNAEGTALLGQMLQSAGVGFSYPKPLSLIQTLIAQATGPDDTVLDFFAGSGTTAHAVLALNAADHTSNRRFILVSSTEATAQEPARNLCQSVTRERVGRAIQGYTHRTRSGPVDVPGLGGEFAYLRAAHLLTGETAHQQIWFALQLRHLQVLGHYCPDRALQQQWTADLVLLYLTETSREVLDEVERLARKAGRPVTVYTWQAEEVEAATMLENVAVCSLPAELREAFGGTCP
ncbi:site-specific DNA-methyltransferase [Deinococcus frigens]|uniref:site-specific DNA-methyltransferase n=1 Tax=Deinococcus frigens TaxID=249403 RepID=UPI0006911F28|nr:site-specific DNA-methyltransferase [Deinococcus frigens]